MAAPMFKQGSTAGVDRSGRPEFRTPKKKSNKPPKVMGATKSANAGGCSIGM